ncbi:SNF2-related protein [Sinomonas albida]|uniref:SNF2-related protein n=1 Tax=Sinomonas albida TaxID=369942 RepID=UPI0010A8D2AE|nr:SNF2-related protein [Sinomonas albida]
MSPRGTGPRPRRNEWEGQADLFSVEPGSYALESLASLGWPAADEFPVNHAGARVRSVVKKDLVSSASPLMVAGFSSIAELVDLIAAWDRQPDAAEARVLLGTEPFTSARSSFASAEVMFTDEVRRYWLEEEGVSLRLSAKVLQVLKALDEDRLVVRFVDGRTRLHAKIYVGSDAATAGSSNFTDAGLGSQIEANTRFDRRIDSQRYRDLVKVAENYWSISQPWSDQFRELLLALLRFVPWQEALARACSDLLDGAWAERYLSGSVEGSRLWPSQVSGIAQALWIVENVGSVLVADATGSGKTRMGAHLVRAVRDRLWNTGRVRRDLTVLVCPPSVEQTWYREAVSCGVSINTVSHGLLSRQSGDGPRAQELAVRDAQILAVDECHNFLSPDANRTRQVRDSLAEHVVLCTATPINRGPSDLLQLVGLLGPDNFEDETLEILEQLERRRGQNVELSSQQQEQLRREIQRFTVRRTKALLNSMVDDDPDSYRHPETGRICRYPQHDTMTYPTGESSEDKAAAGKVREASAELAGLALLGRQIAVPPGLAHEYTDERWLEIRLASGRGLANHHVLTAMRSSKAALIEHVAGTEEAVRQCSIEGAFKPKPTGNMLGTVTRLAREGPPEILLKCEVPQWLTDAQEWRAACEQEAERYRMILNAGQRLSTARERTKADLLAQLGRKHQRVIAFDHHLITLAAIEPLIDAGDTKVIVATGVNKKNRKEVERVFAPDSGVPGIALCSDAMNEGLNLQGASAIVHLDVPTTLRVAEQRVGRVDRMDSPHDSIEAWWPRDGASFATRSNELLAVRTQESTSLLGANLKVPDLAAGKDDIVEIEQHIAAMEAPRTEAWDGIRDALDPVRRLVEGPNALISRPVYEEHRNTSHRVLARVSPVRSTAPWAFLAVTGVGHGAPRWIMLEGKDAQPIIGLENVSEPLREKLGDDPPSLPFDPTCDEWLNLYLTAATRLERLLLPRRMLRALEQMGEVTGHWATDAARQGDHETSERWRRIGAIAAHSSDEAHPDPHLVAEQWLTLVQPLLDDARRVRRRSRYLRLKHITPRLRAEPFPIDHVEATFTGLPLGAPLTKRVTACILGVPEAVPQHSYDKGLILPDSGA